jgi:hypothetical protein
METSRDNIEIALDALAKGIVCIPVRPDTKVPAVAWKPWQTELPQSSLVERWFADSRVNIAAICTGRVIFDCDDPAEAELVLAECGDTPHKLRTPRGGIHLGYRRRAGVEVNNVVRIKDQPIDIRTDGGLELIPNSHTADGGYEWLGEGLLPTAELPLAKVAWTRERTRRRVTANILPVPGEDLMVRRALAWVACVEGAVSGQNGHGKTFRVCCKLTHSPPDGFGLTHEQAWPILLLYNAVCEPPWSEKELEHKLSDAIRKRR